MAEENKFHAVRVRPAGSSGWFAPECDIRSLLPAVLHLSCGLLDRCLEGTAAAGAGDHLRRCVNILQVRILEDCTPMRTQIDEFFGALVTLPADIRFLWYTQVVSSLICVYGLFSRRDSSADRKELGSMMDYSVLSALKTIAGSESWAAFAKDAEKYMDSLLASTRTEPDASYIVAETGERVDGIRSLARAVIGAASDAGNWNELSDQCDREFAKAAEKSLRVGLALCLAYPSYKHPGMVAEYGPDDETDEAAGAAGRRPLQVDGGEAADGR